MCKKIRVSLIFDLYGGYKNENSESLQFRVFFNSP